MIGAFFSAFTIFIIYYEALNNKVGKSRTVTGTDATAGIWATYPAPKISIVSIILFLLIKINRHEIFTKMNVMTRFCTAVI